MALLALSVTLFRRFSGVPKPEGFSAKAHFLETESIFSAKILTQHRRQTSMRAYRTSCFFASVSLGTNVDGRLARPECFLYIETLNGATQMSGAERSRFSPSTQTGKLDLCAPPLPPGFPLRGSARPSRAA